MRDRKRPLTWARDRSTGEMVHISKVSSGLECDCICPDPGCAWDLVAHKQRTSESFTEHFKHRLEMREGQEVDRECASRVGAEESIVHRLAKKHVTANKYITIGIYKHRYKKYKGRVVPDLDIGITKETHAKLSELKLETRELASKKNYQPDITAEWDGRKMAIEIFYRHATDEEKIQKFKEDDIPAIEFNLSTIDINAWPVDLAPFFKSSKYFKWLHYPNSWLSGDERIKIEEHEYKHKQKIDDAIEKELQRKRDEEKRTEERRRQEEEDRKNEEADSYRQYFLKQIRSFFLYRLRRDKMHPFGGSFDELKTIRARIGQDIMQMDEILKNSKATTPKDIYARRTLTDINNAVVGTIDTYLQDTADALSDRLTWSHERDSQITVQIRQIMEYGWTEGYSLEDFFDKELEVGERQHLIYEYLQTTLIPVWRTWYEEILLELHL